MFPLRNQPSIGDVLRARAAEGAPKPAFQFLGPSGEVTDHLTYAEVDRKARAIAGMLQQHRAFGERVLIVINPSLDYIAALYACSYAGAIAIPAYPPGLAPFSRAVAHVAFIAHDVGARLLLADATVMELRDLMLETEGHLASLVWIDVGIVPAGVEEAWRAPDLHADLPAFVQYTSGTTGRPKGVVVTHENLLENMERMRVLLGAEPEDRSVCWLPPYHDMGLIAGILMVTYFGMSVSLMSPFTFLRKPSRWIRALSDLSATITGGAAFAFPFTAARVSDAELADLDLSALRVVTIAAEPITRATIDTFCDRFGPVGFRRAAFLPCYGMAESTLMCSGGTAETPPITLACSRSALSRGRLVLAHGEPGVDLVACGPPIPNLDLIIVDPDTLRLRGERELGEIWIAGPSVSSGYWGGREFDRTNHGAVLTDPAERLTHPGPFLRTGDLGATVAGELYVLGRMLNQLRVGQRRYQAEDLEREVARAHASLKPGGGVVFQMDRISDDDAHDLIVVHEVEGRPLETDVIVAAIRQVLVELFQLIPAQVLLVRSGTIPKTTSGKVQRQIVRERVLKGELVG